jgi:segregation and condensation protein B
MTVNPDHLRMVEALLFAAAEPLNEADLASRLPEGAAVPLLLGALQSKYDGSGVNLVKRGGRWLLQTAPDLAFLMRKEVEEPRRLSRAAVETLAIVAYHQLDKAGRMKGVSRAEIEDIRGVAVSKGTLDLLLEAGWVKPVGRREVPGRPVVYGTTPAFLVQFGLESLTQLPGVDELKAAGLLDPFDPAVAPQSEPPEPEEEQGALDLEPPAPSGPSS